MLEREKLRADARRSRDLARDVVHSALFRAQHRRASSPGSRTPVSTGRPAKSPERAGPQSLPEAPQTFAPLPAFERPSDPTITAAAEFLGQGLSLEQTQDDSERPASQASGEYEAVTLANLTSFSAAKGLTPPARAARRHSHSTDEVTPTRRSERIAKQRNSVGGT